MYSAHSCLLGFLGTRKTFAGRWVKKCTVSFFLFLYFVLDLLTSLYHCSIQSGRDLGIYVLLVKLHDFVFLWLHRTGLDSRACLCVCWAWGVSVGG